MKESNDVILKMRNINVSYNNVKALRGVDFDLLKGEIHAIVGEHRAGKSTLVKLLSGAVVKNKGEIIYKNKKINFFTPQTAMSNGIGMVYQYLNVIPSLNAVENIFCCQMPVKWFGIIDHFKMIIKARELFDKLNVDIDLEAPLDLLPTDKQQMVELARALSIDTDIIIFDEISSKLTPEEMETIYKLFFEFKK